MRIAVLAAFVFVCNVSFGAPHLRQRHIKNYIYSAILAAEKEDSVITVNIPTSAFRIGMWFGKNDDMTMLHLDENIESSREFGHYKDVWECKVSFLAHKMDLKDHKDAWIVASSVMKGLKVDKVDKKSAQRLLDMVGNGQSEYAIPSLLMLGHAHENSDMFKEAVSYYEKAAKRGCRDAVPLARIARNKQIDQTIQTAEENLPKYIMFGLSAYVYYKIGQFAWGELGKAYQWSLTDEGRQYIREYEANNEARRAEAEGMLSLCVPELTRYEVRGGSARIILGTGREICAERVENKWIIDTRNVGEVLFEIVLMYGPIRQALANKYNSLEDIARVCLEEETHYYTKMLNSAR